MDILYLAIGLAVGGAAMWWVAKFYFRNRQGVDLDKFNEVEKEKSILEDRIQNLHTEKEELETELDQKEGEVRELDRQLASARSDYNNLEQKLTEQKGELEELQEKFTQEFENIAHKILKKNTKEFEEHSKKNLGELLDPMKEKLKDFQERIEKTDKENRDRNSKLIQQIHDLKDLNNKMHEDAQNLTKALKGDSKAQGNWGEVILERILEKSGLQKNREYYIQESFKSEEGKRLQPDVIVKLPGNKHIVIDSKVSLTAYEKFCSVEDESKQEKALKEHINSFKQHIKLLSEKDYHNLYELESLDFVLMFVPIEPAFGLAVQNDNKLFNEAFEKNIVIVSTSTLLATLRTIASIWRQKKQTENAVKIAREGGKLYDKFVGFVEDLEDIGTHIDRTGKSYEKAMNKLSTGRGNLVRKTEQLKELGAKASKKMPEGVKKRDELDAADSSKNDKKQVEQPNKKDQPGDESEEENVGKLFDE